MVSGRIDGTSRHYSRIYIYIHTYTPLYTYMKITIRMMQSIKNVRMEIVTQKRPELETAHKRINADSD